MVFSVSPSVIVREVDATAVIPAVATPPAAIAGVFRWGPTDERILITSEDDLVNRFGKPYTDSVANTQWTNHETFFTAADFLSYSNALYVTRVTSDDAAKAAGTYFEARYEGELGNSIEVSVITSGGFTETLGEVGDLTGTATFNAKTLTWTSNTAISEDIQSNDIIRIGNDTVGYQDLVVATATNDSGNTAPYEYSITTTNRFTLTETDIADLSIERRWGYSNNVAGAPSSTSNIHIVVKDEDGDITGTEGTVLEVYENVSITEGAKLPDGTTNYYKDVLENQSAYVKAKTATVSGSATAAIYKSLTSGDDGDGETAISFGTLARGYDLYKESGEVDVSAILTGRNSSANLANYIVANIADVRKDCIVYVSPTYANVVTPANPSTKLTNAISFRDSLQSSSYWFMDSGYKYRYDKYNDLYRWVPMNGDMAGLAARVEPWESPAGYKRGIIKNVVKLAFNPTKAQRDQLYGKDINPVISQVGQGVLLFGDKTGLGTNSGSAFTRVNVRRLFITVEKAIATVASSFLFDFNDEFTQTQFKNLIEPFLRDIQGRRGIIDFRVVSDSTVNTADVIDRNTFKGNIYIKPARSINVIELTFVATRTGIEFDEIVGQPL